MPEESETLHPTAQETVTPRRTRRQTSSSAKDAVAASPDETSKAAETTPTETPAPLAAPRARKRVAKATPTATQPEVAASPTDTPTPMAAERLPAAPRRVSRARVASSAAPLVAAPSASESDAPTLGAVTPTAQTPASQERAQPGADPARELARETHAPAEAISSHGQLGEPSAPLAREPIIRQRRRPNGRVPATGLGADASRPTPGIDELAPADHSPLATDGQPQGRVGQRQPGRPGAPTPFVGRDRTGDHGQQRIQRPVAPGPRAPGRGGAPARGGSAPYIPPGRGAQRPEGGQRQDRPGYDQPGYVNPAGTNPVAPHQPYTPFDPYAGANNGNGDHQPQGGQPRSGRGRQPYGGSQYQDPTHQGGRGYPDQRGPRWQGGRTEPASPASYADRNQPGGQGRRGQTGQHDRRGLPGGRGGQQQGRTPRGPGGATYPGGTQGDGRYNPYGQQRQPTIVAPARVVEVKGIFWAGGGQGLSQAELLDERNLLSVARFTPDDVRRLGLRSGDQVEARADERNGRRVVSSVELVNGAPPENLAERRQFEQLTATFPTRRIRLEQGPRPISSRIIDLFSPLGFGSRALIVAPPKTGKTTLIREAAESVLVGYPDAVVMAVLVGERPEEVTDLRARLEPSGGLVYAASFDEETERHAWLVQVAVERAKRVAESGRDAFMVLDSLTRLARAENLATRGQGRTLSGGIDAQALDTGRRAFGAARNLDEGGSLTILATCLVETGSRQDDVVYEEFKGTGNMELHLSRELSQRRLFPAVDVIKSGTRREEMLLSPDELRAATTLRRRLADMPVAQATEQLLKVMERAASNAALLQAVEASNSH